MRRASGIVFSFLLLSSFSQGILLGADNDAATAIPVRRVVMFSSGVGFFQHSGDVEGNATTKMMFKTDEINDILKSMIVSDAGGSSPTVHYASRDPLVRALQSFAVDLSGNPDLAGILMQIRGAKVTISAPDKIEGTILGLETKTKKVNTPGDTTILQETFLNLLTGEGIKSIPVATIQNLFIQDESLRNEIEKALKLILTSSDKQRKSVEVRFEGQGKRAVQIGYVTEAPVWKVSYRLVFSGESAEKAEKVDKEPFLQSWAIVENTSDQDWSNVQLSLISGRPISFIQELYTPLYLPRPIVQPELYASLTPREYEEGIADERKSAGRRGAADVALQVKAAPAPMAPAETTADMAYEADFDMGVKADSVQAVASGGKVGELFSFTVKDPVSLPRRQSAMLPIVSGPIEARKVSIYNQAVMPKNPLNGAWITNTTGMKLLGGPVTVFDDDMYAGDAQLGNMSEKDNRLISYALDLDMTVDPSLKNESSIVAVKIVKGVMTMTYKQMYTQTYEIKNKAAKDRTLIIEQPFYPQRKLIEPKAFAEKTPQLYRFELAVKSGATEEFKVAEEEIQYQSVRVVDQNEQSLAYWSKSTQLSDKAQKALQQVIEMKKQLADTQQKLEQFRREKAAIDVDQDRLRKDLASVGQESSLGKRYIQKLSTQEDQIEELEKNIKATQAQFDDMNNQLATFIENMTF